MLVGRNVPRLESFSEMPLQHVEIYVLANHLGNHNARYWLTCFLLLVCRYSLPRPPGALNIAGAVDVGKAEAVGGIYIMWVES